MEPERIVVLVAALFVLAAGPTARIILCARARAPRPT